MTVGLIPDQVIYGGASTLGTAIIALAIVVGRTRERVVKMEEWIRRYEKEESDESKR